MAKKRANGEGNIRKRKDGRWEGRYTAGHDPETGKPIYKNVLGRTQAVANHLKYLQLMNDLFLEVNPIPVKTAMNLLGLNVGPMRLPLCEMSEANAAVLRATMEEAGLL